MTLVRRYIKVLVPLKLPWEPTYLLPEGLAVQRGSWVRVSFAGRNYLGIVTETDAPPPPADKALKMASDASEYPLVTDAELSLWRFMADYYLCTVGEVFKMACPAGLVQEDLLAKKEKLRVAIEEKLEIAAKTREGTRKKATLMAAVANLRAKLAELEGCAGWSPSPAKLSRAQSEACGLIRRAFMDGRTALLDGVTGAGKTEVYISLASEALSQGRNVLILVPEIALSTQLEERLKTYFGGLLLIYNSGETMSRRALVAQRVRSGPYIVLGTRSAIFLPHNNLGLVVVDEEHDGAYKQDSSVRYNGRDCAAVLARLHGAKFLLGSATPSLESIYNCLCGKYIRVGLRQRYYGSEDAKVRIIDTNAEFRKNGMVGSFSRKLTEAMRQSLSGGGQVLVLRARRAYSTAMQCGSCGHIVKCPHCNVPLSFHKDSGKLICHYCGSRFTVAACPECGGELKGIGSGTQKIEEEAAALFPEARIARLDSDATPSSRKQITDGFASGNIDILIGTQMLTKGFDFPGLNLVAAIGADGLLGQMDFRADEKAAQLLSQLRGRAGRRGRRGTVIIQTTQSEHPVYQMLVGSLDATVFEEGLLSQRKEFGYPPFTRLVDVILQDVSEARLGVLGKMLAERLGALGDAGIVGPFAPQIDKVSDRYIRIIRITLERTSSLGKLKASIRQILSDFEADRKWTGHITVDVDPL